jgi:hypothetical protein
MIYQVTYDFPAVRTFDRVPWPTSAAVDGLVQRFARDHAPKLDAGAYPLRGAGYRIAVRVDHVRHTVLVLWLEPMR